QAEDGIRDRNVTEVQTCALPICRKPVFASDLALLLLRTSRHGHHEKNEKPESQALVQRAHDLLSRRVPFTLSGDGSGCGIKSVAAGSSSEHPRQHLARCEISGAACWGSSGVLAELLIDDVLPELAAKVKGVVAFGLDRYLGVGGSPRWCSCRHFWLAALRCSALAYICAQQAPSVTTPQAMPTATMAAPSD